MPGMPGQLQPVTCIGCDVHVCALLDVARRLCWRLHEVHDICSRPATSSLAVSTLALPGARHGFHNLGRRGMTDCAHKVLSMRNMNELRYIKADTSYSGLDLGEHETVPEACHFATRQVPSVYGSLLRVVSCLKQLPADGIAGLNGGIHSVVYSVPEAGHRAEHVGLQLLDVV